ncbi:MAG TPA: amidase [Gaiellaceae bacterium]|nr:amidase [Gaiellaceae bacterium]
MRSADGIFLARPERVPDGRPLAVKDLFDTAGLTTTYGSAVFAEHVPERTAEAVLRLERAGWATVGKTNLHELAYGVTSENPHFGTVPNPLAAGRVAGGSSGGNAAALALGLAEGALGTDSGGSIRIPAACCGVVGFKPTWDVVPLDGCFPLAPSFDHAGPMARDVGACAALMEALVPGFRREEPPALADLRAGLAWTEHADPGVRARVEAAAARFGELVRVDLPPPRGIDRLFMREVADVHRDLYARESARYGEDVRIKVGRCLAVTDAEGAAAEAARAAYREAAARALDGLDLLVTPTLPCVAPRTPRPGPGDLDVRETLIRFTFPFNALGLPALALPCGEAEDGLPASVQLVGRSGADAAVLAAGEALERALER